MVGISPFTLGKGGVALAEVRSILSDARFTLGEEERFVLGKHGVILKAPGIFWASAGLPFCQPSAKTAHSGQELGCPDRSCFLGAPTKNEAGPPQT